MSPFLITAEEWEGLRGLPGLAQRVYLMELRPRMDFETGIVGERVRISYQSIAEALYVEPRQGRHSAETGSPSLQAIRTALQQLEEAGLIQRIKAERQLIFRLVLAITGKLRPKYEQQRSNRGATDQEEHENIQTKQSVIDDEQQGSNRVLHRNEQQASDIQITDIKTLKPSSSNARARESPRLQCCNAASERRRESRKSSPHQLPLRDGEHYAVSEHELGRWMTAFPKLDVPRELRALEAWALARARASPEKLRTRRDAAGWIVNCLSHADQKPERGAGHVRPPKFDPLQYIRDHPFGGRIERDITPAAGSLD